MKRWISLLLILVLLSSALGCVQSAPSPKVPVTFYYPAEKTVYDGKTAVIHKEVRDGAGYEDDMEGLLNVYLKGPSSEALRSPFPRLVTVTRFASTANMAVVELSAGFAQLSGIDLTVACVCIANTLFDLTQLDRVQIIATDSQLDGQASIALDRDDFYFADVPLATEATSEATETSRQ